MKNIRLKLSIILYFLILCLIAFNRFPDIKNELKYFIVTQNMLESKNYFILTYFNELYPDKPPIYFWIIAIIKYYFPSCFYPISLIVTGVVPLFATGYIWFKIVKKYWGERLAYLYFLIFLTMPFIFGTALILRMDTLMTLFITIALYSFLKIYEQKEKTDIKYFFALYLSISIGILIKGGASFVIPFLTIVSFLYLQKDFKVMKKLHIFSGIILILLILAIWFSMILLENNGLEYIKLILGQETVGRMIKSKSHIRPFYFYVSRLPLTLLPITPFFLWGVYRELKEIKKMDTLTTFSLSLFVPNLIFFSLISGKLDIYLLPIYSSCILISMRLIESYWKNKRDKVLYFIVLFNLTILGVASVFIGYYNDNYTLKGIIDILKNKDNSVYRYRFSDAKNIGYEIDKTISDIDLNGISSLPKKSYIVTKKEHIKDIPQCFKPIYENNAYILFYKFPIKY